MWRMPDPAVGVLVLHGAVDHVRDGLEASMWVPRRALRLARGVLDFSHLVEVDERVEIGQVDASEGSPDWETLTLKAGRSGCHGLHWPIEGIGRPCVETRQHKGILDGYCGHGVFLRSLPT